MFSLIPFFLGEIVSVRQVVYVYRMLSFLLAISAIIIGVWQGIKVHYSLYIILFFFLLYTFRLSYDTYYLQIIYKTPFWDYFAKIWGICVIPIVSIYFTDFKKINLDKIVLPIFICLLLFSFINFIFYDFEGYTKRSSGITFMWPIGFGQVGVTLSLLSLYFFFSNYSKYYIYGSFFSYVLGVIIIFISASKGPALILILITVIVLLYYYRRISNYKRKIILTIIVLLAIILGLLYPVIVESAIVQRSVDSFYAKDGSTIERLQILKTTVDSIKENYIFGKSFLFTVSGLPHSTYPHNLFLESFFTLGVFGFSIFIYINYIAIVSFFRIVRNGKYHYFWVALLFGQFFLQAQFSLSLYNSVFYWLILALLVNVDSQKNSKFVHN